MKIFRTEDSESTAGSLNEINGEIGDASFDVHCGLGPGLLESVYEAVLADALRQRGLDVKRQVPISIHFGGRKFDEGFP